jgi:hypothetical protein
VVVVAVVVELVVAGVVVVVVVEVCAGVVDVAGCRPGEVVVWLPLAPLPVVGLWRWWSEPAGLLDVVGFGPPLWFRLPAGPWASKATRRVAVPPEPLEASVAWTLTLYTPAVKLWVGAAALEPWPSPKDQFQVSAEAGIAVPAASRTVAANATALVLDVCDTVCCVAVTVSSEPLR